MQIIKFAIFALPFLLLQSCTSQAQPFTISVDDFEKGITAPETQLLDVRTADEYQSGHLANALQADWNNTAEFQKRVTALDKATPIYIYCLSGGRSGAAMQWLQTNGYKTVYNMKGGINAWKQSSKKVEGAENTPQISLPDFLATIPHDKTILVDIGAKWCPPCRQMKPIIAQLEQEKYTVIYVDGGTQTELAKQLNAKSFPTFLMYKNGAEVSRKEGIISLDELKNWLK